MWAGGGGQALLILFWVLRASPPALSMRPCKTYFSHPSSKCTNFFPTPPIKLKLVLQVGKRLVIDSNQPTRTNQTIYPIRNMEQYNTYTIPCSQGVPTRIPKGSQVPKLFPKMFPIAPQIYPIWFAQSSTLMFINWKREIYTREHNSDYFATWVAQRQASIGECPDFPKNNG